MAAVVRLDARVLDKLTAELRPKAAAIVASTSNYVAGKARMLAPVDTGALRNSIKAAKQSELTWHIEVGVEYGIFQELGTSRMAAHPFLVPAVEGQRQAFQDAFKELFRV